MMQNNKLLWFVLILLVIILSGCSLGTLTIKTGIVPILQEGSPLNAIKPIAILVSDFKDERLHKDHVGQLIHPVLGTEMYKLNVDKDIAKLVREAVQKEFERNGHKVLQSQDIRNADIEIGGSILEYWVESISHFAHVEVKGTVKAKIIVKNYRTGENFILKDYSGFYSFKAGSVSTFQNMADVLNEALLNLVKDFTRDPEFLMKLKVLESHGLSSNL